MSYTRQIIFSLLCISNVLLSMNCASQPSKPLKSIKIKPMTMQEMPEEVREAIKNELLKQQSEKIKTTEPANNINIFDEDDIDEMELIFESSPQKAQSIVNQLQNPTYSSESKDDRYVFFIGETGTGKTEMAKAVGYKKTQDGWGYHFRTSVSFLGEYRGQTAMNLQSELEIIEASNKPTVLIIDELNLFLENTESKYHDTNETSEVLWNFLDRQKGNPNFFFIGTLRRLDRLSKPNKNKVLAHAIDFPLITDSKIKSKIFRKYLTTANSRIDEEVTDEFLNQELDRIGPCSGRDLKKMAMKILRISKINN